MAEMTLTPVVREGEPFVQLAVATLDGDVSTSVVVVLNEHGVEQLSAALRSHIDHARMLVLSARNGAKERPDET